MKIQEAVESAVVRGIRDAQGATPARRALDIGLHVAPVVGARPHKVDSAELIGFIKNNDPDGTAEAGDLADAIVDHFKLDEEGQ